MAHMESNHSVSANAVASNNTAVQPEPSAPFILNVYNTPPANVPPGHQAQTNQPAPPQPIPVVQHPTLQQFGWWPVGLLALVVALIVAAMAASNIAPIRDIEAVMVMGGNEVEQAEFTRTVTSKNGMWTPEVSYTYVTSVHSIQDGIQGAQFRVAPGWEMQTVTVIGDTIFRGGERHRTVKATFRRADGWVLTLQRWFNL